MRTVFTQLHERLTPQALKDRLPGQIERVRAIMNGSDDSAQSQRTALFAFSVRIVGAVIAYVMQVLLARWMGEFQYGVYVTVWVAAMLLGGFACFGFQTAVIRFISEYQTKGDIDHLRGVIRWALMWSALAATVFAVTGSATIFFIGGVDDYYIIPIYLAAICLPMMAVEEIQDGISRAFNWPSIALLPTFIARPILILGIMAVFIAAGFGADARYAMLSAVIATYVAGLAQFAVLMWRLRKVVPPGKRRYQTGWVAVALPIFMVDGFYNLLANTDVLFVSYFMTPDRVAVYFAAIKTLALAHFVYFAVRAGTAHRFAAYKAAGDMRRYEEFVKETIHWTFWPSLAMAVLMVVFGKYFLMLFGESFVEGSGLLWILAIGIVVRATVGAAATVLIMSGEQIACAITYGASLFVNIVLNIVLIPRYGLEGAAIATTCAIVFEAAALYVAANRRLGLHIFIIPAPVPRTAS